MIVRFVRKQSLAKMIWFARLFPESESTAWMVVEKKMENCKHRSRKHVKPRKRASLNRQALSLRARCDSAPGRRRIARCLRKRKRTVVSHLWSLLMVKIARLPNYLKSPIENGGSSISAALNRTPLIISDLLARAGI